MKPSAFDYSRPESIDEALNLLAESDDARVIAGGQSLVPMMALRLATLDRLVDLNDIAELERFSVVEDRVHVGALVRQARFETSATVAQAAPLFAAATPWVGHFQLRNRGTVGGSLAHADPSAEYPAVALALDADLVIANRDGWRTVRARDFFVGMLTTAIDEGEILVRIEFDTWPSRSGFGVYEVARSHGAFAMAGAAVGISIDEDRTITRAAISMFGVAGRPQRSASIEEAILGQPVDADFTDAVASSAHEIVTASDIHASAEYRRRVLPTVVTRAIDRARRQIDNLEANE